MNILNKSVTCCSVAATWLLLLTSAFPQQSDLTDQEDHHHHPVKYEFAYGVTDPHTGDMKSQKEKRHGDKVEGSYSVAEPDGHVLTVHYQSDKHSGYQAQVYRDGRLVTPPPAPQPSVTTAFHATLNNESYIHFNTAGTTN